MQNSPFQNLKEKHQSKEKFVDQILSSLKRPDGESKEAFKKRLLKVSSRKLLRLQSRLSTKPASEPKPKKKAAKQG